MVGGSMRHDGLSESPLLEEKKRKAGKTAQNAQHELFDCPWIRKSTTRKRKKKALSTVYLPVFDTNKNILTNFRYQKN